ncbi:receptor-type tyrosine-protein phosphatase mu-like, partial [Anneissia japonica]|uniref:receptor-type tyrosine-protein phosphatase mu-like n=1 Tax=Anneissia japonica TaxID=1529436 RepID=UPI0014257374
ISASSNTKVNPGQISTFQCDIQGNVTGVTIQFLIGSQPAAETARTQANGVTRVTFTGEANPTVTYICRLARDPYTAYADHSLNLFALPTYTGQPSTLTVTGSSVELRWRNWSTSSGDGGDGPVIGYVLYYRRSSSSGLWRHMPQDNSLTATVTGLRWEEEYDFAIAAVREGAGGEGPRGSNELTASTVCGEPTAPVVSANSSYKFPKRINIFWQQLT